MTSTSLSIFKNKINNNIIKNAELHEYPLNEEKLNNWIIPKVEKSIIYKIGTFDFKGKSTIKTVEQSVTVDNNDKIIHLLNLEEITSYAKNYKYIDIGLIQIAFKPLTLRELNASILACLRDVKCLNWAHFLMGVMETSLCHGPVYFNTFPNLSLSLTDINILEAVKLQLQLHCYNFLQGSETIAILFRIHFKIMNTFCPKINYNFKPTDMTTIIETNLAASHIETNRMIKWDEINFTSNWQII